MEFGPAQPARKCTNFKELCEDLFPNFQPRNRLAPLVPSSISSLATSSSSTVELASTPSMANIPIDPAPFVPQGQEILHVPGRNGICRVVLPMHARKHEDWAIISTNPRPAEVFFPWSE